MLTKNIEFKNFPKIKKKYKIINFWNKLKKDYFGKLEPVLLSLKKNYDYSYSVKQLKRFKKFNNFRIYGMGGSTLGAKAVVRF